MATAYTCGGTGTSLTYDTCDTNLDFLDDGSMSIYEKLCIMVEMFKEALDGLGTLDEALALKEDVENLTNARKLSPTGDFTGTWNGETKAAFEARLKVITDGLAAAITDLENEDLRIETKFDDEVIRLDGRIDLKEDSSFISSNRLLDSQGNFTGTWENETYADFKQQITNGETLYQNVIDLIAANPNIGLEVIDGGFFLDGTTPTEIDGGNFTDPVTEEIDAGLFLPACGCQII